MRQGHVTVLGAFSMADMDKHPGAVDISDLQIDALLQAQTTGVDGAKADPIVRQPQASQDPVNLFKTEHNR